MGKRVNIGVYIGPNDMDIAAWFNLLQTNKMSRAKWVTGLFASYMMDRPLAIGTITHNVSPAAVYPTPAAGALLFGVGSSQVAHAGKPVYGWQVRGPNKEFVLGSVINVSISKSEVLSVIDEVWGNGHQLATFLKALIRKNLTYANVNIPPNPDDLRNLLSDFIISQASVRTPITTSYTPRKKRTISHEQPQDFPANKEIHRPSRISPPEPSAVESAPPSAKERGGDVLPSKGDLIVSFHEEPQAHASVKTRKNPLLDKI